MCALTWASASDWKHQAGFASTPNPRLPWKEKKWVQAGYRANSYITHTYHTATEWMGLPPTELFTAEKSQPRCSISQADAEPQNKPTARLPSAPQTRSCSHENSTVTPKAQRHSSMTICSRWCEDTIARAHSSQRVSGERQAMVCYSHVWHGFFFLFFSFLFFKYQS